jgi:putative glutamine amidotransferase
MVPPSRCKRMTVPVIGIIPSRKIISDGTDQIYLPESYILAVADAGGAPLVIPLGLPEALLNEVLPRLDGLLFSGGGDVHPERYGSQMHPAVSSVDKDRDRVELYVFHETLRQRKPFLGICRGFQVINVALGGTLYEDILDQHPDGLDHRHQPGKSRHYLAHRVTVEPDSRLGAILGQKSVSVNSMHHQGVRQLASELAASAWAPDGIIEGFELPDQPFALAVQWHPECLQEHASMRALFRAFVAACQKG